ncbi:RNA polymerase sigma factor [Winogradskya humida]|uniref:RNA polymerase sigma factor n=1 Tax=Winogradskya humida TaxID=113566 RepID=A0ABQ3ZZ64_9ACTN|nr:RNA polymerase sigma factor [Actinoplanes humidus]
MTGGGAIGGGVTDDEVTGWALAAGRGDADAAAAFIRATQRQVWRFLHHLAAPGEIEDLVQETYLRALRSLPSFAGRSTARTWLFTIARRVAADQVRAAVSRPRIAVVEDWQAAADAATAAHRSRFEDDVALRDLLGGLPGERREAFVATQLLGLSYAEAAEVCDCPIGTIRSRVARAREDLMAVLADRDRSRPAI